MFEGSEKKLELTVHPKSLNFKNWPARFFQSLIKKSGAKCVHQMSNSQCTSYLLSESSLFVWDHRLLLITCGQTTLSKAMLYLLKKIGVKNIQACFFQRKNEFFPLRQKTSFYKDVKQIRKKIQGSAYRFGDLDGHHFFLFHLNKEFSPTPEDQTVEILMYGLPYKNSLVFSQAKTTQEVQQHLLLSKVFPNFTIQDHIFKPQGYSLNAVRGNEYYTIHATPQKQGFYISFETNMRGSVQDIIQKTLIVFKPLKFDLITFLPSSYFQSFQIDSSLYFRKSFYKKRLSCGFLAEFSCFQMVPVQEALPFEW